MEGQFEADKWKAVYAIGFEERPQWLDAAGLFLYQVADGFQQMLTHQPDLEVAREHVEVPLDENVMERLLNSVPFTLGAEHVNEKWLKGAFSHLQSVYAGEIAAYDGTVALYLADKSQQMYLILDICTKDISILYTGLCKGSVWLRSFDWLLRKQCKPVQVLQFCLLGHYPNPIEFFKLYLKKLRLWLKMNKVDLADF